MEGSHFAGIRLDPAEIAQRMENAVENARGEEVEEVCAIARQINIFSRGEIASHGITKL